MQVNSNRYVLAIDLGSGGPKVGLVNQAGEVVANDFAHTPLHFLPNGGVEQDPNEWWQATSSAARNVIRQSGISAGEIVAVAVTSQWSVVVAVDENGEVLMNAISWLDTRGAKYNHQITDGFPNIGGYQAFKLVKYISLVGDRQLKAESIRWLTSSLSRTNIPKFTSEPINFSNRWILSICG